MLKSDLYEFENDIVEVYKEGRLRSPIHLSGSTDGNLEDFLIDVFKDIKKDDWVATTYRSHYHALLKGVPKDILKNWILDNKSIHFMDKEYKMFSSAIVGGTLPTALGIALGLKNTSNKIYVFIGDMTIQTGVFNEVFKYAVNWKLPIKFICECNHLSTDTNTAEVWGITKKQLENQFKNLKEEYPEYFDWISYTRKWPHYGCGVFITKFKDKGLEQDGKNF